jgi:hypothetical protein
MHYPQIYTQNPPQNNPHNPKHSNPYLLLSPTMLDLHSNVPELRQDRRLATEVLPAMLTVLLNADK